MNLILGLMEKPIYEQVGRIGDEYNEFEKDNKAINRLLMRGLVTEGEVEKARKRLMVKIKEELKKEKENV